MDNVLDRFDRVLLRVSSVDDEILSNVLKTLLPLLFEELLALGLPVDGVPISPTVVEAQKRKLIEIINHVLTRIRGNTSIQINIKGFIDIWRNLNLNWGSSNGILSRRLFSIFVNIGLERIRFDTHEQRTEVARIIGYIVVSFYAFRQTGMAPLAAYVLASLLDPKITQSQELVYDIGQGVWSAWDSLANMDTEQVDSTISDLNTQQECFPESTVNDNVLIDTSPVNQINLFTGLIQTLIELLLLPVNFDKEQIIPGFSVETFSLWKAQIPVAATSIPQWINIKSHVIDWLCATARPPSTTVTALPLLRSSLPSPICSLPLIIASTDSFDTVRVRAENRCVSLDTHHVWVLARLLHLLSTKPLTIYDFSPTFSVALFDRAVMPSVAGHPMRLPPKLYSKLFDVLRKSPRLFQVSNYDHISCDTIISYWTVDVCVAVLEQPVSESNQVNSLELLASICRTFNLVKDKEQSTTMLQKFDIVLQSSINLIIKTLRLPDNSILMTSLLLPSCRLIFELSPLIRFIPSSAVLLPHLHQISSRIFALLDATANMSPTLLSTAVTDVSSLLQCLGLLAKTLSTCFPSHVPSDLESLFDQIASLYCKTSVTKCELLRWSSILFLPCHPYYRLFAVLLSTDSDRSVSALAKQIVESKFSNLPSREVMIKKIGSLFLLPLSDEEFISSALLQQMLKSIPDSVNQPAPLFSLPMTNGRCCSLIDFLLKCPEHNYTASPKTQIWCWLVLLCLAERLLFLSPNRNSYLQNYFNVLHLGLPFMDIKPGPLHDITSSSSFDVPAVMKDIFHFYSSRFDIICEGVWCSDNPLTTENHRSIGSKIVAGLFNCKECTSEIRNGIRERIITHRMIGNPTDVAIGKYKGSIIIIRDILIDVRDDDEHWIWVFDIFKSVIHTVYSHIYSVEEFLRLTTESCQNHDDILFSLRVLPTLLEFVIHFINHKKQILNPTCELIEISKREQQDFVNFMNKIGNIVEHLMKSDQLSESLSSRWKSYMRRDLRRHVWMFFGALLQHLYLFPPTIEIFPDLANLPNFLIQSLDRFLITLSSKFDSYNSAFAGRVVVDLIKTFSNSSASLFATPNVGNKIFDIVLGFCLPSSCSSISDVMNPPSVLRFERVDDLVENGEWSSERSHTCVLWLAIIVIDGSAEPQLMNKQLRENVQLSLISCLGESNLLLTCFIWRSLVALQAAVFRLYRDTTLIPDKSRNIPLAFAQRGFLEISQLAQKMKAQHDNKNVTGSMKDQKLAELLSDSVIYKRRLELLDYFCQIAKDLTYAPLLFGLMDQSTIHYAPTLLLDDDYSLNQPLISLTDYSNSDADIQYKQQFLDFFFPKSLSLPLVIFLYHPDETVRTVTASICKNLFGYSTIRELLNSESSITEMNKLSSDLFSTLIEGISGDARSSHYRHGSIGAINDVLLNDFPWSSGSRILRFLWMTTASALETLHPDTTTPATANQYATVANIWISISRSLRSFTARFCKPSDARSSGDVGQALTLCFEIIRDVCSRYASNKQISLMCMDTLRQCIDNSGSLISSHLPDIVPFLIEALAALEPAEFKFYQFHAEREFNITSDDFMEQRLSLSSMTWAGELLQRLVSLCHSNINQSMFQAKLVTSESMQLLSSPLCSLLSDGIGIPTRAGVLMFIESVVIQNGPSVIPKKAAGKYLNSICHAVFDPSSSISKRSGSLVGYLAACPDNDEFSKIFQKRILSVIESDDLHVDILRARIAAGVAVNSINSKNPAVLNQSPQLMGLIVGHAFVLKHDTDTKCCSLWSSIWMEMTETENRTANKFSEIIVRRICLTIVSRRWNDRKTGALAACHFLDLVYPKQQVNQIPPPMLIDLLLDSVKSHIKQGVSRDETQNMIAVTLRCLQIKQKENKDQNYDEILQDVLKLTSASHAPDVFLFLREFIDSAEPASLPDAFVSGLLRLAAESKNVYESAGFQRWKLWVSLICYKNPKKNECSLLQEPSVIKDFLVIWIGVVESVDTNQLEYELLTILIQLIQYLSSDSLLLFPGDDFSDTWKSILRTLINLLNRNIHTKAFETSRRQLFSLLVDLFNYIHSLVHLPSSNPLVSDSIRSIVHIDLISDIQTSISRNLETLRKHQRLINEIDKLCDSIKNQINIQ